MNYQIKDIPAVVQAQKEFFRSGATLDVKYRKAALRRLLASVEKHEKEIYDALWHDLHKSEEEAYLCETSIVRNEIKDHLRHVARWAKPKRAATPLTHFPSCSRVLSEPLGSTLIIAPWNYPVTLLLCPLVGAISAGCTAVLKPSPYVPQVSAVLQTIVEEAFEPQYVAVFQGHRDVNTALLEQRWDLIFFTGSPALAKTVMAAAAKNLTPVILELGGKSPCIVDRDADIEVAARRIAWGKTLNCGQTCIAPDYLLLHKDIKERFVEAFREELVAMHGEDPAQSPHYVRMVSDKAFRRVTGYLSDGKIIAGGHFDAASRYIEPTLLDGVSPDDPVMQEEIFGPVFPILEFTGRQEVVDFVCSREKPLAFYYFGKDRDGWEMLRRTSSGGACINDTIMHFANSRLPFGGVGNSGMGRYHGAESFRAFSNRRAVIDSPRSFDLPFRYMPYKLMWAMKMLLR
ncbi:MAG: aldehyde dehydrogenase [Bacteroidales bacterium]|nr:aldehyde dehydrogenase [Bacteroidales bacterium]